VKGIKCVTFQRRLPEIQWMCSGDMVVVQLSERMEGGPGKYCNVIGGSPVPFLVMSVRVSSLLYVFHPI
jgi:hypothetical protein